LDRADTQSNSEQADSWASRNLFLSSFVDDALDWPERIIIDANEVLFRPDNFAALMLAGGASISMHQSNADKDLARHFIKHRVFRSSFVDESFNVLGCPGTHFAAAGLWYGLSAEDGDQFNKERAWTMMTALAVTGLTTVGLKAIRDNETPNGKAWAWPSGHTSSSFTAAAVLDEFYGPGVGISAYILAGLVGFRMMDAGDHWASDVVFGATLGWVVGHTVAGKHKKLELAGFEVLPYTAATSTEHSVGVTLVKTF
jgi:membrane-associated phospholipid phosphatase